MSHMLQRGLALAGALIALLCTPTLAQDLDASGPPQRIIVKLREDHSQPSHAARADKVRNAIALAHGVGLRPSHVNGAGADVMKVERRLNPRALAALLAHVRNDASVEYAEEDVLLHRAATPNDARYNEQWHYFEPTAGLRLPGAWDISTGSGVIVAVLDTGLRMHADLAANVIGGYDFISDSFIANDGGGRDSDARDPGDWNTAGQCGADSLATTSSWHGTHVAGTIAAATNNASGVAGVAYNAKLLSARVLGRCGGYTSDIADAIIWSSGGTVAGLPVNPNPAKVLSLSLGGPGACGTTTQNAINSARSRGAVVIVAAGNENTYAGTSSPGNCQNVVVVSAVNRSGGRASYSNYGAIVDVAAPGGQLSSSPASGVLSTLNTGTQGPGTDTYAFLQGTSMATPHVSGVAALMLAKSPGMTPDQVESTLKSTARAFPVACSGCGVGIVDATAAVGGASLPTQPLPGPTALTNGVALSNQSASTGKETMYTLAVPAGASNLKFEIAGGTGDADLYVKFGSAATTSSYDCRPYLDGNNETCSIATAQAGTYFVLVSAYAGYSGLSIKGSYSPAVASAATCPTGYRTYAGTLAASGNYLAPTTNGYVSAVSGTHAAILAGPAGSNFNLHLQKRNSVGWSAAAASTGTTSSERITYSGTAGTYRWRVHAYSGSGSFTLCEKHP
jgi:serine protease